jgi:altronate hydrolase
LANTQRILAGLINHPHAAGVLVLGLGCENNRLVEQLALVDPTKQSRVRSFSTQVVDDEEAAGLQALRELAELANEPREELPLAELVIGMKCGGSDGFSGITANPLVGRVADRHCGRGGTVLLTEIPEMFGAEGVLAARCLDEAMRQRVAETIEDFKDYFRRHGEPISENPSPGNKSGGITTLEEKSLGCVQKAGTSGAIRQVLDYGEPAAPGTGGLGIIYGPGNDGVSITALAAAGANLILFTTGRGTPMGAPVPTLKIATNRELAQHKARWIDFDAGRLLDGTADFPTLTRELEDLCWQIANRQRPAQNEVNGFREIAIWKTGVTL